MELTEAKRFEAPEDASIEPASAWRFPLSDDDSDVTGHMPRMRFEVLEEPEPGLPLADAEDTVASDEPGPFTDEVALDVKAQGI